MTPGITLIGDGVENPWNAAALLDAVELFEGTCVFRAHTGLRESWLNSFPNEGELQVVGPSRSVDSYAPLVALDNLPSANEIYGFQLPPGPRPALIVGNERRGITREMQRLATHNVMIPMQSRSLNCLNVAVAAAIALYYLSRGSRPRTVGNARTEQRRPELLLLGPADHIDCGSAIRSAGAFGWQRILLDDRAGVWFDVDRITRSESRAAARRARNPIRVIPSPPECRYVFDEVCIVTSDQGVPITRANLARGSRQVLVIPDPCSSTSDAEDWERFGKAVTFTHLDLPESPRHVRYRFSTGIALAESARQIGRRQVAAPSRQRREPYYDRAINLHLTHIGETIDLAELDAY